MPTDADPPDTFGLEAEEAWATEETWLAEQRFSDDQQAADRGHASRGICYSCAKEMHCGGMCGCRACGYTR